jgi:hypothetical protein
MATVRLLQPAPPSAPSRLNPYPVDFWAHVKQGAKQQPAIHRYLAALQADAIQLESIFQPKLLAAFNDLGNRIANAYLATVAATGVPLTDAELVNTVINEGDLDGCLKALVRG